jgi:hypothetical protein
MKQRLAVPLAVALALVALFPLRSLADADPAAPSSSSAASPRPSAEPGGSSSAAPKASSDAGAPLPAFDAEPFPPEPTPAPKREEWTQATPVALTRNLTPCRAYRVREWMKVNCSHLSPAGIGQITGPQQGVALAVAANAQNPMAPRNMEIIFPLRRGTGHMFQLLEIGEGYDGPAGTSVALILADHWVEGESPIITLH